MASEKSVPWIEYRIIKIEKFLSEVLSISSLHDPENTLKFSVKTDASLPRHGTLEKKLILSNVIVLFSHSISRQESIRFR